ncbi:topoisomerase DNA-binding C4 zinc finger domain-containing protein [Alteromonas sp. ASW11-19]|uniref:Topoisomerase DNA-binding C4 zinc finger domain-containing protein n=1 Tax=Alteromonas salexigens TaxID=2982530 RepID=A0ABT2VK44_9ALTE|nr:topoisomerase DNA-binding C4 zinc finger domain-containing protein [Alteromonas salexigens]MCU7553642.1 topoisomerase DNA-binding C4 zinc finger domain-containing protein [Alteromonas salexigens]
MTKIDQSLFSAQEHALEHALGDCPDCGKPLQIRNSKSGPFVGCSGYPDCDFSKPLYDTQTTTLKVMEGTECPLCQSPMALKKGRYGMFIGCANYPDCQHIAPMKEQDDTHIQCPKCQQGQLVERTNKYGKQFFSCSDYPACRYVLNSSPVNETCPECGWGVLIAKKGQKQCPQPACGYKASK